MKTKVYGTIGPACQGKDVLVSLFEKGMTGIRMNLSHMDLKDAGIWLTNIRQAYRIAFEGGFAGQTAETPEIMIDLKGPELRLGKMMLERKLMEGDMLTLLPEGLTNLFDPTEIPVPACVIGHLEAGQEILLDDGKILLRTEECYTLAGKGNGAECRVLRGGTLCSRKSIALPGKEMKTPTLTASDLENIALAKTTGITGVMLPFVRGKEDLLCLRQALDEAGADTIRIFAKIENQTGVEHLQELLPYCDEIVIARGDLGNAVPLWELPVVQEKIARACKKAGKPFMVVTQMLSSMENNAVPTRAEVSDIFRAVEEGAASVMLTGETAAGRFPVEAMGYMVNTVRSAEKYIAECRYAAD